MAELTSILKTFIVTAAIIVILQVRIGGVTLETRTENFLQRSGIAVYVQSVAAGGVLAISNLATGIKNGVTSSIDGFRKGSEQQSRAQR